MHINDYLGWKRRFHTYVLAQNSELWTCFTTPYNEALEEAGSYPTTFVTPQPMTETSE
ncbi:hypothetical protein Hanom_Chr11g00984121 [Helianthus anomalus]